MNWNPVTFLIHIRESTNPHLNWSLKVHTYTKANENKKACVSNISRLVARTSFRDDLVNYAASRLAGWLAGNAGFPAVLELCDNWMDEWRATEIM